jgi:prepilin-type N-terminal cleavage/methylation domain-containing protein
VNTETRTPRTSVSGFTLIEVVIALVILAVGLLGLEALGIAASKMAARATVQSEYTSRAGTRLESLIGRIRSDDLTLTSPYSASSYVTSASGRAVATMAERATKTGNTWSVRISVRPGSTHPVLATRDSIYLTANVYDPD